MKLRDYTPDDLPMIRSWYKTILGHEGPHDAFLKRGFVVESNIGIPMVAVFYYIDGHFCDVDWLVGNPDFRNYFPSVVPFLIETALPILREKLGEPNMIQINVSRQSKRAIPALHKYGFEHASGSEAVLLIASQGLFKETT